MDLKENLATNLIKYRKASGLTQAELAEKLNYSDKAVSKWERGESFPDLVVLKQIADLYGVKIDTLISEPVQEKPNLAKLKTIFKNRAIISLCSVILVWLVATICFTFIHLIIENAHHTWLSFIYAIPVSMFIVFIYGLVWKKKLANTITLSILIWTLILAIFLTLRFTLISPPNVLWMIFLIGIPLQFLIILMFYYKKVK